MEVFIAPNDMASSTTDFRNFPTWESHPHFGHAPWNRLDGQANSPMHGTGAGLTSSGPYSRAASFGEEDGEEEQGVGIPTSKSKDNRRTKLMQNTDKTAHLMVSARTLNDTLQLIKNRSDENKIELRNGRPAKNENSIRKSLKSKWRNSQTC